jgi:hypothetical protein
MSSLTGSAQQLETNVTLGSKGDIVGHTGSRAALTVVSPDQREKQATIDQGMTVRGHIGQEDAHLAVGSFAESTAILRSDADGVLALFGKATLVDDEDAIRSRETRSYVLLQCIDDGSGSPGRLSQEALEGTGSSARHGFSKVLGVAAVSMLEQQAAQVLLAASLSFGTAKGGGEVLMKGGKVFRHALKRCRIHLASSQTLEMSSPPFYLKKSVVVILSLFVFLPSFG